MVGFEIVLDIVVSVALLWLVGEGRKAPTPVPIPDVDLPSIGELLEEAARLTGASLTPAPSEAVLAPVVEVVADAPMPRHNPQGGRRRYHQELFARARALQEEAALADAALLTVATIATSKAGGGRRQR